jgi:carboxymethylenebutenolidase
MKLEAGWVDVPTGERCCSAYRAKPAATTALLPAVLMVQEVWGVDAHIRDVADRVATAGYLVLAPDLYSVGSRPPELFPERIEAVKTFMNGVSPATWSDPVARAQAVEALPESEREAIGASLGALFGARDPSAQVGVLGDCVTALLDDEVCDGHVGVVGWCMGGMYAGLLACREVRLWCAVVFYGSPPVDDVGNLECPLLGFYGGEDHRITDGVPAFAAEAAQAGKSFEHHVYPRAHHAFFNDTRRSYHVAAARDAWARCLEFFATHLAPEARGAA